MKANFISKIAFSILALLKAFSGRNSHVIIHHWLLKTSKVDPLGHMVSWGEKGCRGLKGRKQDLILVLVVIIYKRKIL